MIKKIWLLLVVLISLVAFNASMPVFASSDLTEEEIQAANNAYKTGISLVQSRAYDKLALEGTSSL